jgi:transposase-like protein
MTTTRDAVGPKKHQNDDRSAEAAAATELVRMANEQGFALTGPDWLLKLFTKNVLETALNAEMNEWSARPWTRCMRRSSSTRSQVKIRDGHIANRPVYAAIGVTLAGEKDVLGLWVGTGGEGAISG